MPYLPEKKESPIMGVAGVGGGAGSNLVSGLTERVYVDDVYATYTYKGFSNNDRDIINDLDLAGKGGMVIQKARDYQTYWPVTDTVRGANNMLRLNEQAGNNSAGQAVSQFNDNGFNIGDGSVQWNSNSYDYSSWSFCKQEGFFDIVTYEGTGSQQQVPHNLGCIPSMIWVKRLTGSEWFCVWTKEIPEAGWSSTNNYFNMRDETIQNGVSRFGGAPSATHFTVGYDNQTNSTTSYVAYLWGGGAATGYNTTTNPLANSCRFNGAGTGNLTTGSNNADFTATGDWTLECWFKPENFDNTYGILMDLRGNSGGPGIYRHNRNIVLDKGGSAVCQSSDSPLNRGQWYHVAGTRVGNNWYLYLNGTEVASGADSVSYTNSTNFKIGKSGIGGEEFNGWISNVRWTNGQVLYPGGFRPSLEPLTTTSQGATASNVKMLCCQNSTVTGTTVAPSGITLTNGGGVTLASNTPFSDKNGHIFGKDGDQDIVKMGSYYGNGGDNHIYIGWQPQFVLVKRMNGSNSWMLYDQHRNFGTWRRAQNTLGDGYALSPSNDYVETSHGGGTTATGVRITTTPTGIKFISESNDWGNNTSGIFMWFAIRDIDAKVARPAESATDIFAIDEGSGSSAGPNFDTRQGSGSSTTGFIRTDWSAYTVYTNNWSKRIAARSINSFNYANYMVSDGTSTGANGSSDDYLSGVYDFEGGNQMGGWSNTSIAWMFRKSEGFTTFSYQGNGNSGLTIAHDLGGVPEMMWIQNRVTADWKAVYHFGANDGVTPWLYGGRMNTAGQFDYGNYFWDNTAPTEYDFTLGNNQAVNWGSEHFCVAMWRSVPGISKCGWYTGDTNAQTIQTGFVPRYLMVKASNANNSGWGFVDTTRGWGAGDDKVLYWNTADPQSTIAIGAPHATNGFTLDGDVAGWNANGVKYVYYAHA